MRLPPRSISGYSEPAVRKESFVLSPEAGCRKPASKLSGRHVVSIEPKRPRKDAVILVPKAALDNIGPIVPVDLRILLHMCCLQHVYKKPLKYTLLSRQVSVNPKNVLRSLANLQKYEVVRKTKKGFYFVNLEDVVRIKYQEILILMQCKMVEAKVWYYLHTNQPSAIVFKRIARAIHSYAGNVLRAVHRLAELRSAADRVVDEIPPKAPLARGCACASSDPRSLPIPDVTILDDDPSFDDRESKDDDSIDRNEIQNQSRLENEGESAAAQSLDCPLKRGVKGRPLGRCVVIRQPIALRKIGDFVLRPVREYVMEVYGDPLRLLRAHPWTAQLIDPEELLKLVGAVPKRVVFKAMQNALKWVADHGEYNQPFYFMLQWLRGSLNLDLAAAQCGMKWTVKDLPQAEQIEIMARDAKICPYAYHHDLVAKEPMFG